MTTERGKARHRTSTMEMRLYVVALLAAVYTMSWRAIGGHAPATELVVNSSPMPSEPQRFVWLESLPSVTLPAGWQLASHQTSTPPARVVHVPTRRAPRVRTRSS